MPLRRNSNTAEAKRIWPRKCLSKRSEAAAK